MHHSSVECYGRWYLLKAAVTPWAKVGCGCAHRTSSFALSIWHLSSNYLQICVTFPSPAQKKKHTHTSHHITSVVTMDKDFSDVFLTVSRFCTQSCWNSFFQQMSAMSGRFVPAETTTSCMSWCSPPKWIITSTWNHLGLNKLNGQNGTFFPQTFSETYGEKNLETWNLPSLRWEKVLRLDAQVASPPARSTRRHLSPATSSSFRNSWPRCLQLLWKYCHWLHWHCHFTGGSLWKFVKCHWNSWNLYSLVVSVLSINAWRNMSEVRHLH